MYIIVVFVYCNRQQLTCYKCASSVRLKTRGGREGEQGKKVGSSYKRQIKCTYLGQILFEDGFQYTSIFSRGPIDTDTVNEVSMLCLF